MSYFFLFSNIQDMKHAIRYKYRGTRIRRNGNWFTNGINTGDRINSHSRGQRTILMRKISIDPPSELQNKVVNKLIANNTPMIIILRRCKNLFIRWFLKNVSKEKPHSSLALNGGAFTEWFFRLKKLRAKCQDYSS